ncbi:nuclear transport factor 2 family protein [Pseudomonas sp.]|uniref:nuclear transport factor 2 family protein n=1 Tax=Pseudomonas sp. TaxID=306 RepID=UPI0028AE9201|nr:nuclear transport factor 2 family protein [Pseudomonas sp.]
MTDTHRALIERFYQAFQRRDAEAMIACYSDDVVFDDPVFGRLQGQDAGDMWRMLVGRAEQLQVSVDQVAADAEQGQAHWQARYRFGPKKRWVANDCQARFSFRDGLICRHGDSFDFWRWSRQALGAPGLFLGWSSSLRSKVRQQAIASLRAFQQRHV